MTNTDVFQYFDMVVSIPVATVNDQLGLLTELGVIESQLIIVQSFRDTEMVYTILDSASAIPADAAYINGQIVPSVAIDASGTDIAFVLKFASGTARLWMGNGPAARLVSYDMTGWSYGIDIDMNLAEMAGPDNGKPLAMPATVSSQLKQCSDSMFTVNQLFMDFESTNLLQFNPTHSTAGTAGDEALSALLEFMQFYLKYLVKVGNPYILGYSLTTTPATKYPANEQVPPSLRPTGTTYTMYRDAANPDLSTLNFLLVTGGGKGTIGGATFTFPENWIQPGEQIDAKLVYGHAVLIEALLLEPFFNEFRQQVYDKIRNDLDVGIGKAYAQARSATATGFSYDISNVTSGDSHYVNLFDADFSTSPGQASISLKGTLKFYREHSKHMVGCTARAWMNASVDWSGTITLSLVKDANGVPTLQTASGFTINHASHDKGTNSCEDTWAVVGSLVGKILDTLTMGLDKGFFTNLFESLFTAPIPGIGNLGGALGDLGQSVQSLIILPAGQVFFFKSPAVDSGGNLSMGLTYKSQT